jgi:hypothetical protein
MRHVSFVHNRLRAGASRQFRPVLLVLLVLLLLLLLVAWSK